MGELQPLRDDLPEPVAALATAMRDLFDMLEVSLTRLAARLHFDKSSVSRYLSGHTVPPWKFVEQLMVEATVEQSDLREPTQEVVNLFLDLHRKAQVADDSPSGHLNRLSDQLARKDVEIKRARRSEQRIEAELIVTQRQIAQLKVSERVLEAKRDVDAMAHRTEVVRFQSRVTELIEERARLREKVAELTEELGVVQQMRLDAERECQQLESDLDAAEQRAAQAREQLSAFASAERDRAKWLEMELEKTQLRLRAAESGVAAEAGGKPGSAADDLYQFEGMRAAGTMQGMRVEDAARFVHSLSPHDAAVALKFMDPYVQTQILEHVPVPYRRMILNRLHR